MTIHQLIQKLLEVQDANLKVYFIDYEQGEIEIESIRVEAMNQYSKITDTNPLVVKVDG